MNKVYMIVNPVEPGSFWDSESGRFRGFVYGTQFNDMNTALMKALEVAVMTVGRGKIEEIWVKK